MTHRYILSDSKCNIAVAENAACVRRILSLKEDLPDLRKVVQIHGEVETTHPDVLSWSELVAFGEEVPDGLQLVERLQDMAINKCCTLVYTSGTTGNPKGCARNPIFR